MGDVKDILGVPREGPPPGGAPKSKKTETPKLVKPKGMSRHASLPAAASAASSLILLQCSAVRTRCTGLAAPASPPP